jgi:hypothetical protein
MNNKIDIGNVLLVDFKDLLPIDRITRVGSIVVLLTSGDREAFSRGSPIEEELCRLRLPKHPCFARANLENCTKKVEKARAEQEYAWQVSPRFLPNVM